MPTEKGCYDLGGFIQANISRYPVFLRKGAPSRSTGASRPDFQLWPDGLCTRIQLKDTPVNLDEWLSSTAAHLPRYALPPINHYHQDTWEFAVRDSLWAARQNRAQKVMVEAIARKNDQHLLMIARDELEDVLAAL